ncbi:toxin HicA [Burkholderia lata]|uniref:toxin HicA n=1 Tax=Burkholderia lata (strain ATCC 17760 / DSM 23089 / LMG 22485 / NCIMB 9086 / R18194 / 383) TaxID=482957 RepID=UPI001453CC0F|nr:toxin HicA [Burkholderia lata]VWC47156.1 toxin HicA [Burkholderia lata]
MVSLLTPFSMASDWKILEQMRREPANVRFGDLFKVCEAHFGQARQSGSSHAIFKTPWQGDPRVNIQNDRGKAKACQVRQVLDAIDRLKEQKS